jgi:hypothetical protein
MKLSSSSYKIGDVLEKFISPIRGGENLRIISTKGAGKLPIYTVFLLGDTLKSLEPRHARNDTTAYARGTLRYSCSSYDLDELRISCSQISSLMLEMQIYDTLVSTSVNLSFETYSRL